MTLCLVGSVWLARVHKCITTCMRALTYVSIQVCVFVYTRIYSSIYFWFVFWGHGFQTIPPACEYYILSWLRNCTFYWKWNKKLLYKRSSDVYSGSTCSALTPSLRHSSPGTKERCLTGLFFWTFLDTQLVGAFAPSMGAGPMSFWSGKIRSL